MKSAPSLTSTSRFSVLPNDQYVPPVFHTVSGTSKYDHICFDIQLFGKYKKADLKAMLDCGASTIFIHPRLVKEKNITTQRFPQPIQLRNIDNSMNAIGMITHEADIGLRIGSHEEIATFAVADIGDDDIILGIDWLRKHNPEVDWRKEHIAFTRCPRKCGMVNPQPIKAQETQEPKAPRPKKSSRRPLIGKATNTRVTEDTEEEEPRSKPIPPGFSNHYRDFQKYYDDPDVETFYVPINERAALRVCAGITKSQLIAQEKAIKEGDKTLEEMIPQEFIEFMDVFSKKASERLPTRKPWDHSIDLIPGSEPPFCKVYPMSPSEQKALDEYLEENLAKGYIKPSKSPAASPVFYIKKKDGSLRLVVDYRRLNAITIKNRYPLPLSADLLDKLSSANIFSKLDLRWGYNNIRIKDGDEWKAAFRTRRGLFEPSVMGFGLTNAPATFQNMMNEIFKDLIDVFVIIYLDDILIFSDNKEDHVKHVQEVLKRLREHDLFCKPEKCEFFRKLVEYLGLIISKGRIAMDEGKVKAILEWPVPKNVKDIQAFLGFANFYRRFIEDFSGIVKPMTSLLRKDAPWKWTQAEEESFKTLKDRFTNAPALVMPDMTKQFIVEADASDFATGAVLSQKQDDGKIHPIAFMSKSLNDAERNYEIYDKELLAVI